MDGISVWDLQTGTIANKIKPQEMGGLAFSGNRGNLIVSQDGGDFLAYSRLDGAWLCQDSFVSSRSYEFGAHWIHEDTLRIATCFTTNMVEIYELRPTSNPPLHLLDFFTVPPHESGFSFSPVSYHATFVTGMEVVVLDVRSSKTLLRTEVAQENLSPQGRFSPDGRFFACGLSGREIRVWQHTHTGYLPWSSLRPRLSFEGFSFSPISPLILTWGPEGIQLLHPDGRLNPPSPDGGESGYRRQDHLVAYSADHAHIATARKKDRNITVLDLLSGTLRRSINTNMEIREIGAVDDTIFVANEGVFAWWDLKPGGRAPGTHAALEAASDAVIVINPNAQHFALSHDYSRVAFSVGTTVFLYDVGAQETTAERESESSILDLRFSFNGHGLQLLTRHDLLVFHPPGSPRKHPHYLMEWGLVEDGGFGNSTYKIQEDVWSWANLFSRGCHILSGSGQWVVNPRGSRLLWLPPSWRVKHWEHARWGGDFLALLDGRHELPIIIEFCP